MSYFKQLTFIPTFDDLSQTLFGLVDDGIIDWGDHNQICINTIPGYDDDYKLGTGSLTLNWDDSKLTESKGGMSTINVDPQQTPLDAKDFTIICKQFKNTRVEDVYECLKTHYSLGRVRFMKSKSKTCLTWHTDCTPRVHLPLVTQEGCLMVVENEVMHLPQNTWWEVDTTKYHTAFNGSLKSRIHLVAEIFGYNQ